MEAIVDEMIQVVSDVGIKEQKNKVYNTFSSPSFDMHYKEILSIAVPQKAQGWHLDRLAIAEFKDQRIKKDERMETAQRDVKWIKQSLADTISKMTLAKEERNQLVDSYHLRTTQYCSPAISASEN